jgi:hypothetical protein
MDEVIGGGPLDWTQFDEIFVGRMPERRESWLK